MNLTNNEIIKLCKYLDSKHPGDGGNCGSFALALARELPVNDKKLVLCYEYCGEELDDLSDFDDELLYHVAFMCNDTIFDCTGTVDVKTLEKICFDNYGDRDPIIESWEYNESEDNEFRRLFEWNTAFDVYPEYYQKLIREYLKVKKNEGKLQ